MEVSLCLAWSETPEDTFSQWSRQTEIIEKCERMDKSKERRGRKKQNKTKKKQKKKKQQQQQSS